MSQRNKFNKQPLPTTSQTPSKSDKNHSTTSGHKNKGAGASSSTSNSKQKRSAPLAQKDIKSKLSQNPTNSANPGELSSAASSPSSLTIDSTSSSKTNSDKSKDLSSSSEANPSTLAQRPGPKVLVFEPIPPAPQSPAVPSTPSKEAVTHVDESKQTADQSELDLSLESNQKRVLNVYWYLKKLTDNYYEDLPLSNNNVPADEQSILAIQNKLFLELKENLPDISKLRSNSYNQAAVAWQNMQKFCTCFASVEKENIDTHFDSKFKRYVANILSALLVLPLLYRMVSSYYNYGTVRFWQPTAQRIKAYADANLPTLKITPSITQ